MDVDVAYEVTKRIGGHHYRYRVEPYRDPETGRARRRWRYVGRVVDDGALAVSFSPHGRASQEQIVAATAALLETRDVSHLTVSVIAKRAGISSATFYRYFPNRKSALASALTALADRTFGHMTLDGPLGTREEEARRVSTWLEAVYAALLHQRAFRWSFRSVEGSNAMGCIARALLTRDATRILATYLRRLCDAGLANLDDPMSMSESIMRITIAFVHFLANNEEHLVRLELRMTDTFLVIERAIFGSFDDRQAGLASA